MALVKNKKEGITLTAEQEKKVEQLRNVSDSAKLVSDISAVFSPAIFFTSVFSLFNYADYSSTKSGIEKILKNPDEKLSDADKKLYEEKIALCNKKMSHYTKLGLIPLIANETLGAGAKVASKFCDRKLARINETSIENKKSL